MMCSQECRWSNLLFNHENPDLFVQPQCGSGKWCLSLYAIYRFMWAAFFTSMLLYDGFSYIYGEKWFIYFTDWSFTLLTLSCICQFLAVLEHIIKDKSKQSDKRPLLDDTDQRKMPVSYQVMWAMNTIAISSGIVVSISYWTVYIEVFFSTTYLNVVFHTLNSIYIVSDFTITGIPVRLLHFYLVQLYSLIYVIFTVVYWKAGGKNEFGHDYIYAVLDYGGNPQKAFLHVCGLILGPSIMHCVFFVLYKLRVLIYNRFLERQKCINPI